MYISIHNYNFQLKLKPKNNTICVTSKSEDFYILEVPADFKENELLVYLKKNAKSIIKKYENQIANTTLEFINIYTKDFIYKWKPTISISYRYNNYIYSPLSIKTIKNKKKIITDILTSDIKTLIGLWEERLNCIIENIYFKNFKTKHFLNCHQTNSIAFSSALYLKDSIYLDFIVAKAVMQQRKFDHDEQVKWMEKFVKDYKQCNKIYDYERSK